MAAILDFISAKFVMCYRLFYIHGPVILHFFELRKYQNGRVAVCSKDLIRSLADLAEHICQIKRSDGNFFLKRVNEHFFFSGRSNQRVGNMGMTRGPGALTFVNSIAKNQL